MTPRGRIPVEEPMAASADRLEAGIPDLTAGAAPWTGNQATLALIESLGPGQPLEPHTRQRMESAFGERFAHVQVHAGPEAAAANRRLSAQALTVGEHVAFAAGNYRPGTPVGDAMLAHELAHTIQQGEAAAGTASPALEPVGSPLEADADAATFGAMRALWGTIGGATPAGPSSPRPALRSALRVQRCSCGSTPPPQWDGRFEAGQFEPHVNPKLLVIDNDDEFAQLFPFPYTVAAEVAAIGGTDEQARHWEAGFTQTVFDAETIGHYALPSGQHHRRRIKRLPHAAWDGGKNAPAPWYTTPEPFTATDQMVSPLMDDWPHAPVPWESDDKKAVLHSTEGFTHFGTWLIVKQRETTKTIGYLKWDTWQIDWTAAFDGANKKNTAAGPGASVTGKGDGVGAAPPVLSGPTANDLINARGATKWEPWR
jgi:hypothetical protein